VLRCAVSQRKREATAFYLWMARAYRATLATFLRYKVYICCIIKCNNKTRAAPHGTALAP
jgi:hypothetical protein